MSAAVASPARAAGCAGRHDAVRIPIDGLDPLHGLETLAEPADEPSAPVPPCDGPRCSGRDPLPNSPAPSNIGASGGEHWCLALPAAMAEGLLSSPRTPSEAKVKGLATGLSPLRPPR
jgi:hypothetical protein